MHRRPVNQELLPAAVKKGSFMQLLSVRSRLSVVLAVVSALALAHGASCQSVTIAPSNDPAVQQLRQASLGFLEKGEWSSWPRMRRTISVCGSPG